MYKLLTNLHISSGLLKMPDGVLHVLFMSYLFLALASFAPMHWALSHCPWSFSKVPSSFQPRSFPIGSSHTVNYFTPLHSLPTLLFPCRLPLHLNSKWNVTPLDLPKWNVISVLFWALLVPSFQSTSHPLQWYLYLHVYLFDDYSFH